jgi:hypothetical protein
MLDEPNLFAPRPALQLLFPIDRGADVIEALDVNETIHFVSFGKSLRLALLVLPDPLEKIVTYANVKRTGYAGDDVYVEAPVDYGHRGPSTSLRSARDDSSK